MRRIRAASFAIAFSFGAILITACAPSAHAPAKAGAYDPQALPSGPVGREIAYGRDIVMNTQARMPHDVRARMSCAACHIGGGTVDRGGSLVGTYAQFPQWNRRAHRVIALQDRLAECFLYSMNGRPPAFDSREMVALVAYIAWLSRGTPTMSAKNPRRSFIVPLPSGSPDVARGGTRYAQSCRECHRADGAGAGLVPPLWGAASFNDGAGMSKIDRMTGFVFYNMPADAPGALSLRDAYDISGYVLSHQRPAFDGSAAIAFPVERARHF